jgi:hypothetical protein
VLATYYSISGKDSVEKAKTLEKWKVLEEGVGKVNKVSLQGRI